jgi:FtsZ-interacting cell division protein ZipA
VIVQMAGMPALVGQSKEFVMDTVIVVGIIVGIVVLAAAVMSAVWYARQRRRASLQQRFGPEYEREVQARGSEHDAAQHLSQVADRRDQLDIRHLEPAARDRYTRRWETVQSEFVDRPATALDKADRLVTDVMRERGYPVEDFSERAELVAADHPQVVEHYRAAHAARQVHHGQPDASETEDLRQAFVHYRMLFDELVHSR